MFSPPLAPVLFCNLIKGCSETHLHPSEISGPSECIWEELKGRLSGALLNSACQPGNPVGLKISNSSMCWMGVCMCWVCVLGLCIVLSMCVLGG